MTAILHNPPPAIVLGVKRTSRWPSPIHGMRILKILLVDDNRAFLKSASEFLSKYANVEIVGRATSGAEGVRLARAVAPDLVFLDLAMPGMNGIEVAQRLKASPAPPHVVILTLQKGLAYRAAALEAGADGFIPKDDFADSIPQLLQSLGKQEL